VWYFVYMRQSVLHLAPLTEADRAPDAADYEPIREAFELTERAVADDGTLGIRIIAPGWGNSGYYSREVLERDIPQAFPPGTQLFWNHDTPAEESQRPEGDLSRLAGVTVSEPAWDESGPVGPGMYARIRPFSNYASTIDEIGEHIGVSIRAAGERVTGEAEGRQGPIVQRIAQGRSIDFVTRPGAGGQIVRIFEAAGREPGPLDPLTEAHNLGNWLESRLHLAVTEIADNLFGDGIVTREERRTLSAALGQAMNAYHEFLMSSAPEIYQRARYEEAPAEAMPMPDPVTESETEEDSNMDLEEALAALETAQAALEAEQQAAADLRQRLLVQEAQAFLSGRISEADLPTPTAERLARQLVQQPDLTEAGALDEAAYGQRVDAAITEARAEIAAIAAANGSGQIRGMGSGGNEAGQPPDLQQSEQRITEALAGIGYGVNGGTSNGD
jgi:hypothetical protein